LKSPAVLKVNEKVPPPGAIDPLLNVLPLSVAVTVCVAASLFIHVTFVPFLTVSDAGEKAKFFMTTVLAVVGVEFVLLEPELLPHE
jgi:hypothetical protein